MTRGAAQEAARSAALERRLAADLAASQGEARRLLTRAIVLRDALRQVRSGEFTDIVEATLRRDGVVLRAGEEARIGDDALATDDATSPDGKGKGST